MTADQVIRGVGMLEATRSFLVAYGREVVAITAGSTRCIPDHELVQRNPLAFKAADADDLPTRQAHCELIVKRLLLEDDE